MLSSNPDFNLIRKALEDGPYQLMAEAENCFNCQNFWIQDAWNFQKVWRVTYSFDQEKWFWAQTVKGEVTGSEREVTLKEILALITVEG